MKDLNKVVLLAIVLIAVSSLKAHTTLTQQEHLTRTDVFGNYNRGVKFYWLFFNGNFFYNSLSQLGQLGQIKAYDGDLIDQIQFISKDGEKSPYYGGQGGSSNNWKIPEGQWISKVVFRSGSKVYSMKFVTNKGTQHTFGAGYQGKEETVNIPEGSRIIGFRGSYSDELLSIGLLLDP